MASTNIHQAMSPNVPRSRIPLATKSNSPSPHLKSVRRKSSFIRRADSSEDLPSPHGSIYEASFLSHGHSEESSYLEPWQMDNQRNISPITTANSPGNDENNRQSRTSQPDNDSPFIYGRGTTLDAIPESRSNATLRTLARAKSMDDLQNNHFIAHRDSFSLATFPRRKQSFSVDDIKVINNSYHEAITMIENEANKILLDVPEVYAEPKSPVHEPPKRPATPPGMPSWTAHQNMPQRSRYRRGRPTQNRFQRFFGLPASWSLSSRVTVRRAANTPIAMARFRPPRSVYTTMAQHPFNQAPVASLNLAPAAPSRIASEHPPEAQHSMFGSPRFQRLFETARHKPGQKVRFNPSVLAPASIFRSPQTPNNTPAVTRPATPATPEIRRSMIPIPRSPSPTRAVAPKQKQCPHGKLPRRKLLKPLHWTVPIAPLSAQGDPPPISQEIPASPPRLRLARQSSFSPGSPFDSHLAQNLSTSSTTHLISDGLLDASPILSPTQNQFSPSPRSPTPHFQHDPTAPSKFKCWRCKLEGFAETCLDKVYDILHESKDCFCLICCGYDADADSSPGSTYRYINTDSPARRSQYGWAGGYYGGPTPLQQQVLNATPVIL